MTYSSKMEMRACVVSDSWPRVSGNVAWTCPVFPAISYIRDHGEMFIFLPKWHKRYSKITIHVYSIYIYIVYVYIYIIYIIPSKKIPDMCPAKKSHGHQAFFFSGASLDTRIPIPKVVGHTRLIQITSATFGALLVPFHTVTMLPIEAGRRKRKENPPKICDCFVGYFSIGFSVKDNEA